jgi:hypothetical protein
MYRVTKIIKERSKRRENDKRFFLRDLKTRNALKKNKFQK